MYDAATGAGLESSHFLARLLQLKHFQQSITLPPLGMDDLLEKRLPIQTGEDILKQLLHFRFKPHGNSSISVFNQRPANK